MFKRIILHWTGGLYNPNDIERKVYHFLIHGNGTISKGIYSPEDNLNCGDGRYAAHTGGGNTGSIGVSLCGMFGFDMKSKQTIYPITQVQFDVMILHIKTLLDKYKLTPSDVMTHAEFGNKFPKTSSYGKIDILYLPPYPNVKPEAVGDFIRNKL